MGSRNPVIFVEGENGSLDIQIYQKAYNDFLIIPVGSCEQVKSNVKNFNTSSEYHHLKCYGIIDKDKLDDAQVRELKKDNIYTLEVSELENILLSEEVVKKLFDSECSKNEIFSKTKYIDLIFEFVKKHKNKDILENVKKQMRSKTQDVINQYKSDEINFSEIDAKQIKETIEKKLEEIINNKDLNKLLKVYQNKGLYKSVLNKLLNANDIDKKIISLVSNENVLEAIRAKLPNIENQDKSTIAG